jgi:RimJ/RimL family protein N-acetyltransferase
MPKRSLPPIQNQRIRLCLLEESDLPMTLGWRNQSHIRRWFFHSDVITPEQHRAWFERYVQQDDDYVFVIQELGDILRPVGQVALYHIDWTAKRAEFGRLMIGEPDARGKGSAREATELLVGMALGDLGLQEVYLEMFADNVPALAIYTACGFQVTGRRDNVLRMSKAR